MSNLVLIPIEGERTLLEREEHIITNYRVIQRDRGSNTSVGIPLHVIREYKLTSRSGMFKVVNGIINVIGAMPQKEALRGALGLREFDRLRVGDQRKLCEMSGLAFVHPDYPYGRWATIGYHRPFSQHFYQEFAWIRGENVFTYYPNSFILTNYRLYQKDEKRRKLYIFPLHMVETFEAKGNKIRIKATSGKFEIKGKVPRQDHMLRVWQMRAWDTLPKEHLDWLIRPYDFIQARHPLSQYSISDSAAIDRSFVATETKEEMEVASGSKGEHTVFVKPVIKDRCTNCNAPLSWEQIDWVGPDQYQCPSCGATHRVDYVRM
ncbi:MAG: hypothetical protein BAJATHORv1_10069 [Candidatus Thorarchaeota archaeon]|nr:MAG: hypothetical protein BAJATHORv1_10069 [Candidatus Thorarchaeota archaeon]